MNRKALLWIIPLGALLLYACAPEVNIELVDAKTMLENQVLGSYEELGEDVWMVSNVRVADGTAVPAGELVGIENLDEDKAAVLTAYLDSLYLSDEIRHLKHEGLVGETWNGLVEPTPAAFGDVYVGLLVYDENDNRQLIYERLSLVSTSVSLEEDPLNAVGEIFGQYHRERLQPGEYFFTADGAWIQVQ
ncbi:YdbL family protein [bacterium]|nr:YdbL family protein [bacterium]